MIQHLYETIDDPIDVEATSHRGRMKIKQFVWKGSTYRVKEECLLSKVKKGQIPIWMFSVLTDYASYKIRFETDTLSWWLEQVYSAENHEQ